MYLGSDVDEWEIETVSVVRRHDCRFAVPDMLEPPSNKSRLVCLVEDGEVSWIFVFRRVLEIIDIFANDFSIRDEETLLKLYVNTSHTCCSIEWKWNKPVHQSCKKSS